MLKVEILTFITAVYMPIKGVSFEVNDGEIVSLIGANGAGKSTILKTVSGLLRSKTGSITFKDESVSNCAPNCIVKKGIAHVPEGRRIFLKLRLKKTLKWAPIPVK